MSLHIGQIPSLLVAAVCVRTMVVIFPAAKDTLVAPPPVARSSTRAQASSTHQIKCVSLECHPRAAAVWPLNKRDRPLAAVPFNLSSTWPSSRRPLPTLEVESSSPIRVYVLYSPLDILRQLTYTNQVGEGRFVDKCTSRNHLHTAVRMYFSTDNPLTAWLISYIQLATN